VKSPRQHPLIKKITHSMEGLTPKGRILGQYIIDHPRKAVFMTTKELAEACQVSEATVVRFVSGIGYERYSDFQQTLRDCVDTELTLLERRDLMRRRGQGVEGFRKTVSEEIDNLTYLFNNIQAENLEKATRLLVAADSLYVIGSRLSYTMAYYMGWSLTKLIRNIRILNGSDSTTLDWLTLAPKNTLVVIVSTSRYPNELVRLARWARRKEMQLLSISDGSSCPVIPFAHLSLTAPSRHIPILGSPTSLSCLINYLVHEVGHHLGNGVKEHQEEIEQTYMENDLLFNPTHLQEVKKRNRGSLPSKSSG